MKDITLRERLKYWARFVLTVVGCTARALMIAIGVENRTLFLVGATLFALGFALIINGGIDG